MDRPRLLTGLVTVAAVVLAAVPAVVVFGLGWLTLGHPSRALRRHACRPTPPHPSSWVLFALFYLAWMLGLMVLLIWTYDRLGRNWRSWDERRGARRSSGAGSAPA